MKKFFVTSELEYDVETPVTFLLNIRVQQNHCQRLLREQFILAEGVPHQLLACDQSGNRFDQIRAEIPGVYRIRYEAEVEMNALHLDPADLGKTLPEDFGLDDLQYLYPSRYCQSDRLGLFTFQEFGDADSAFSKVQAVNQWIAGHIAYVSGSTHSSTSAVDSLVERQGVCRDFAHLGIAMCRAMNIPARYFTGYACGLEPPDFHACFETFVGGHWLVWDATGLASPDGLVRIGMGRDAADVSVCTAFGGLRLLRQSVMCVAEGEYEKLSPEVARASAISLNGTAQKSNPDQA